MPSIDNMCALSQILRMPIDDLMVLKGMIHPYMKKMNKEERRMTAYLYRLVAYVAD